MPRPKTTVTIVADALAKVQAASADLQGIDLRTTRGELRDAIRDGRTHLADALAACEAALLADAATLAAHSTRRAG